MGERPKQILYKDIYGKCSYAKDVQQKQLQRTANLKI